MMLEKDSTKTVVINWKNYKDFLLKYFTDDIVFAISMDKINLSSRELTAFYYLEKSMIEVIKELKEQNIFIPHNLWQEITASNYYFNDNKRDCMCPKDKSCLCNKKRNTQKIELKNESAPKHITNITNEKGSFLTEIVEITNSAYNIIINLKQKIREAARKGEFQLNYPKVKGTLDMNVDEVIKSFLQKEGFSFTEDTLNFYICW